MSNSSPEALAQLAEAQYNVQTNNPIAVEQINFAAQPDNAFTPECHGPRNVPIKAVAGSSHSAPAEPVPVFTHFPIIKNNGRYVVYLPKSMTGIRIVSFTFKEGIEGQPLENKGVPAAEIGGFSPSGPFIAAYETAGPVPLVGNASHPYPVLIEFLCPNGYPSSLEYIVVGDQ